VVHLPMGVYRIERTLTIPRECDMQIIGDSGAETGTVLQWSGKPGEPLLRLEGPSHATLRDFSIQAGAGIGIQARHCDQPGGKIYGDQVNVSGGSPKGDVGLLMEGVEQSDVLMRNCQGGTSLRNWIRVAGGTRRQAGKAAPGQVSIFTGATGTSDGPYLVEKGGRLLVRSVYHEMSGATAQAILLKDSGTLFIDATRFSYATSAGTPLIALDGFRGDFTLLTCLLLPVNSEHTARIAITGNGSAARVLCMANLFWQNRLGTTSDMVWQNTAFPSADAAFLLNNVNIHIKEPKIELANYGALEDRGKAEDAFIQKMLTPLREARIWLPSKARPGVTDLQLHRILVSVANDGRGIELRAGN